MNNKYVRMFVSWFLRNSILYKQLELDFTIRSKLIVDQLDTQWTFDVLFLLISLTGNS